MPAAKKIDTSKDRTTSVVLSFRVWPDMAREMADLAKATGLSYAGLLASALDLLRADPGIQELIAANKAYEEAFNRIMSAKRKRERAQATKPARRRAS